MPSYTNFISPLRYPGGKTKMSDDIQAVVQQSFPTGQKVTLVEPYAGGAGASLKLLFMRVVDRIIINDLNDKIYSFWKVIKEEPDFLIDEIKKVKIDIDEWRRQKAIYKSDLSSMNEIAFATLFLNRTNRSGILGGGPIGGTKQAGEYKVTSRFKKDAIISRIEKIKVLSNKIDVCNKDGIKLLKGLEQRKNSGQFFVFLDPPYYDKGSSLYFNHYKDKDHDNLCEFLKTTSLKWLMTYDDSEHIRELYQEFKMEKVVVNHSAYAHKKGKEFLISPAV